MSGRPNKVSFYYPWPVRFFGLAAGLTAGAFLIWWGVQDPEAATSIWKIGLGLLMAAAGIKFEMTQRQS